MCDRTHLLVLNFIYFVNEFIFTGILWSYPIISIRGVTIPDFYSTALKGFQGIVFTHGVQMGRWVGGQRGGGGVGGGGGGGGEFVQAVFQKP